MLEAERARMAQPHPATTVKAGKFYRSQNSAEQRRLLETVLSNDTFDRRGLCSAKARLRHAVPKLLSNLLDAGMDRSADLCIEFDSEITPHWK
jgi:hypothetical protein